MAVLHINVDAFEHRHVGLCGIVEFDVLDIDSALLDIAEGLRYFFTVVIAMLLLFFFDQASNLIE